MDHFPPEDLTDLPLVREVVWHDEVGSTNALVAEAARDGAAEGLVVGAEHQTAGRGRRGRVWVAPPGSSLMCSVLLRPTLPQTSWPLLTLVAGVAVQRAVAAVLPGVSVALKWPNDLLVEGVKAAGILAETSGPAVVVGMGINTDWREVARPDGLVATSVAEHLDGPVDRGALLRGLLRALGEGYAAAQADPGGVVADYVPRCATLGTTVVALGVEGVDGTAVGLTPEGHLRIRTDAGREHVVAAGDVEHLR